MSSPPVRPDVYVANSHHVAERIHEYYRRDSYVFSPAGRRRHLLDVPRREDGYYLFLGRLVPYKRADLAVAARPARPPAEGGGPGPRRGEPGGGRRPGRELVGRLDDGALPGVLAGARTLLFPARRTSGSSR